MAGLVQGGLQSSLMFMTHFLRGYEMGCTDEKLRAPGPDSQPRAPETA